MKVTGIIAVADNGVIGKSNKLPWHLPKDMAWFRSHTIGKPVIMGRKTFESLGCNPLPSRTNVVLTRKEALDGVLTASSVEDALQRVSGALEAMIIGGAQVYNAAMNLMNNFLVTRVHGNFEGDATIDLNFSDWELTFSRRYEIDDLHSVPFTFEIWEKRFKV